MGQISNFGTNEAREKAVETRRRRSAVVNTKGQARDRRERGEVRPMADAVSSHCAECCGFDPGGCGGMRAAVEDCQGPECHLYLFRNGVFHLDEAEAEVRDLEAEAQAS